MPFTRAWEIFASINKRKGKKKKKNLNSNEEIKSLFGFLILKNTIQKYQF
jgi:hypothetical protein